MQSPEPRPTCGAKCRDGHACRTDKLMPNGRCRMHGGKSLQGIGHPNFRHGYYSKGTIGLAHRILDDQERQQERAERVRAVYQEMRAKGPVSQGTFRRLLRASRRQSRPDKT